MVGSIESKAPEPSFLQYQKASESFAREVELILGQLKILGGSGAIFLTAPSWDELIRFSYYRVHG